MTTTKHFLRVALRLHEIYRSRALQAVEAAFSARVAESQRFGDQARTAIGALDTGDWSLASIRLRRTLTRLSKGVVASIRQTCQQLLEAPPRPPDLRSLIDELRRLEAEWGALALDFKEKTLAVTTEPIELEGIPLGPFEVRLSWPKLRRDANSFCFEVVALQPNPAGSDESVTHPHVRDNTLCAGDAINPIRLALEQGRLTDAFCLVRSVLEHYNSAGPFVALHQWDGESCRDCGALAGGDELYCCEDCDHDFCYDCMRECSDCQGLCCGECISMCDACKQSCCSPCLTESADSKTLYCNACSRTCAECNTTVPKTEFDEAAKLCKECTAKQPRPARPTRTRKPSTRKPRRSHAPRTLAARRTA